MKDITSILGESEAHLGRFYESRNIMDWAKEHGIRKETAKKIERITREPRLTILNDQPVDKDSFHMSSFVRTLTEIVLSHSTETPITIGLDGAWGTGKTSIMRMIETQARMLKWPCIWLNGWSLESHENLIAAVASEVNAEWRNVASPKRRGTAFRPTTLIGQFVISMLNWIGPLASHSFRVAMDTADAAKDREKKLEHLTSFATAHQPFQELVEIALKYSEDDTSRLIVFIDDIDRALPDQIVTILKILKLILESPRCIFLIGMDMDSVASSIQRHYRRQEQALEEEFGRMYLEKIVQISVKIPPLTWHCIEGYLEELGIDPRIKEIIKWAPARDVCNPRRLKRYINWLSITLQLIAASELPAHISNYAALKTIALKRDYPDIYFGLLKEPRKSHVEAFEQHYKQLSGEKGLFTHWKAQEDLHSDLTYYMQTFIEIDLPTLAEYLKKSFAVPRSYDVS